MTNNNTFGENFKTALESIRAMADANTVIGEPITTAGGSTIIPVSKLSMGYASGSLGHSSDKSGEKAKRASGDGGLGASGLSVEPVAFLVVSPDGAVEMLNIAAPVAPSAPVATPDAVSSIIGFIERSPEFIERLRAVFAKKKDDSSASTEADT